MSKNKNDLKKIMTSEKLAKIIITNIKNIESILDIQELTNLTESEIRSLLIDKYRYIENRINYNDYMKLLRIISESRKRFKDPENPEKYEDIKNKVKEYFKNLQGR